VLLTTVSCVSTNSRALAGPWSTQPLIGVAAIYASNPELLASNPQSETHAALFVDLPVNYDLDTVHFAAIPRVRYGGATGYSAVTSNYYHLDASAQYKNELDSLTLTGALYRDSSLLYAGELANGVGVRRDTSAEDVNWQRSLTERVQVQLEANTSRTLFAQNTEFPSLVDYRYSSLAPALAYSLNERDTARILGGASRYYSLNGFTASDSDNLQLGLDHKLSELWTLSTSAGYSKTTNQYNYIFATFRSTQNGAVYAVNLTRQDEVLALIATASRALAPTGLAFLSREDSVNLSANYAYSERWTFNAGVTWQSLTNPLIGGGSEERRFYNADLSAVWHWTEQLVVTMHATVLGQRYGQPAVNATSNGLSLEISRQFYRTNN
jgi:hypothetical protein